MNYIIKTHRLVLRPLSIDDLHSMHTYTSDIENVSYMVWLPNRTVGETAQFLTGVTKEWEKEAPDFYEFAITLDGRQIGHISVYLDDKRDEGELGWILDKRYWNRGYAREAAFAIKDFAIRQLKVKRLTANCDHRNTASYKLMEKLGLTLESDTGVRTYFKTGERARELVYSLAVDGIPSPRDEKQIGK